MIKLQIIGHLGRDAEVRQQSDGGYVINFSVAHSYKYTNREGVEVTNATWVNCSYWRGQGKSIAVAKYLKKGAQVFIEGEPKDRLWFDSNNKPGSSLDCKVMDIKLLGSPSERVDSVTESESVSTTVNGNGRTVSETEIRAAAELLANHVDDLPF